MNQLSDENKKITSYETIYDFINGDWKAFGNKLFGADEGNRTPMVSLEG